MKKLFLLAILLGLSGCGDNNQSDTSQSDPQMTQLQTTELAAPTVTNYNLTASSLMMTPAISPLGGWSITNSTVMGASTLIDTVKDTRVSAALVTPNAKQVAEVLRGGAAGVALTIAVDQLLDAVDWVMDSANNQIRYQKKDPIKPPNFPYYYKVAGGLPNYQIYAANKEQLCSRTTAILNTLYSTIKYKFTGITGDTVGSCTYQLTNTQSGIQTDGGIPYSRVQNLNYDPTKPEFTLPLEVVAEKVISNADTGSLDAQVATNAATQNILNDAVQAEPVVQELENNANDRCREHNSYQNGKASLIEGRYNEMFIDVHNLYRDYRTLRPTHPDGWGTWQGHINKYKEEQQNLNAIIVDAILDGCPETERANRWKKKENPPKPSIHSPG
ncbi:hypothetical protein HUN28_01355 [Acinetobacter oleivorans]|uniref:hypothetical protein n=1 Tax=Acinetobacter oleivorans TaxID=1148157 RepID=UPI0015800CD8|nr:hypothetical protein [Acinetobacter oleivorans]